VNTVVLIGGQESGRRVQATGQPEYRFVKKEATPLTIAEHESATIAYREVRYIKTECHWQGHRHTIYVWEHDIHRDLIELMTSELARLAKG
jgi:hypothetical protein